jgi:hypothetical protein
MTVIHRLLDDAFAGIEMTAEVQDLKEEMRADLEVRVADLESTGLAPDAAARRAVDDLGDIRSIVDEVRAAGDAGSPWTRMRVRPRPAFVVRTVLLSVLAAAALAVVVLGVLNRGVTLAGAGIALAVLAVAGVIVVTDSLRQETTQSYPVPRLRAQAYGVAAGVAIAGSGIGAIYLGSLRSGGSLALAGDVRERDLAFLVAGGLLVLAAIVGFTYLGVTQTNRHKPWVVRLQAQYTHAGDRFERDPAAAARFGIYTVTIWIVTLAAFAVLTITIGWAWSWIAIVGGLVAFFLTLARMLFAPDGTSRAA